MGVKASRQIPFGKRYHSLSDIQTVHRLHPKTSRRKTWPLMKIFNSVSNIGGKRLLSKERLNGALFSEYDVMLIQNSWIKIAADMEMFGIKVYRRIFDCEPCLKILFGWMDIEDEQIESNPSFRRQARLIIGLIDKCVRHVEELDLMGDELTVLGKRHMKLRGYGFKSDHWKLFKMSIMLSIASVTENDSDKNCLLSAWDTLMSFVVETMRIGFEQGIRNYFEKSAASSQTDLSYKICRVN